MDRVLAEERILVDTGPFFRFRDGGKLQEMVDFLGERLEITLDVKGELKRHGFTSLEGQPFFENAVSLTPRQFQDAEIIRKMNKDLGDHAAKNIGEITTVICARDRADHAVMMDDTGGIKLAHENSLTVIRTTQLVAEMVSEQALSEADGLPIFLSVYSRNTETQYRDLVAKYRGP